MLLIRTSEERLLDSFAFTPWDRATLRERAAFFVPRGSPPLALFGATVAFCAGASAESLFGPTAGYFESKFGLSSMQSSWLVAIPVLSGSLLRIPFGAMVDTDGGRTPFLALLGMAIIGMIGLLVFLGNIDSLSADSTVAYPLLLTLGVLVGCGIAVFSVGVGQISYWYPNKSHGRVNAIYAGFGNLAPGAMAMALPFVIEWKGIFFAYLMRLGVLMLGSLVYYVFGRSAWYFQLLQHGTSKIDATTEARERYGQTCFPTDKSGLRLALATLESWILVFVYFNTFGGSVALTAWLPTYWSTFHGVPATTAGILTAWFSMGASSVRILAGPLADRFGGKLLMIISNLVMCAGALVLVTAPGGSIEIAILGESILGVGMGIGNAAVYKVVPRIVPQAIGAAAGLVGGLGAFGGFAIPPIMGAFVWKCGPEGYAWGFSTFVVLSLVSILISAMLKSSDVILRA